MEYLIKRILERIVEEKELLKARESILENSALRYAIQNKIKEVTHIESIIMDEYNKVKGD